MRVYIYNLYVLKVKISIILYTDIVDAEENFTIFTIKNG